MVLFALLGRDRVWTGPAKPLEILENLGSALLHTLCIRSRAPRQSKLNMAAFFRWQKNGFSMRRSKGLLGLPRLPGFGCPVVQYPALQQPICEPRNGLQRPGLVGLVGLVGRVLDFDTLWYILHFVQCVQIRDWHSLSEWSQRRFLKSVCSWIVSRGDCCTERCSWPWCLPHGSQRLLGSMDACAHYCECLAWKMIWSNPHVTYVWMQRSMWGCQSLIWLDMT